MLRTATSLLLLLLASPALAIGEANDFPSLLGGETLRGSSAALATAGFATLGIAYGQGVTASDDLGVAAQLNWSTTELVLGGFWNRQLGRTGGWDVASKLGVGWYANAGSTLVYDSNRHDRGLQLAPGVAFSSRGMGLFSVGLDMPFTITTWRQGGLWISPRVAAGYEASLYDQVVLGVRGSLAWRGGTGGTPMRSGQVIPELLVTATWKAF